MRVQIIYPDIDKLKCVYSFDYYHIRKIITSAIMQSKIGDSIYIKVIKK